MTERPILFSGPMVRAIIDGRKTQTRRVVKTQPQVTTSNDASWRDPKGDMWRNASQFARDCCPYGVPGDRLWVREAIWTDGASDPLSCYAADFDTRPSYAVRKIPSIHMRRDDSRITLEIVSVRVERLNEINLHDAFAEGCPADCGGHADSGDWFEWLWNSINADKHPWDSNPWVWVVEFKKLDSALEAKEPADAR